MTKKIYEDSIHPTKTDYDKAINVNRMEERGAHILNNPAMQIAATMSDTIIRKIEKLYNFSGFCVS